MGRYSVERSPGGKPPGLRPASPMYLRTAIVPDEPIRAKGTEWGKVPPSPCTFVAAQPQAHPLSVAHFWGHLRSSPSLASLQPRSSASAYGGSVEELDNPLFPYIGGRGSYPRPTYDR